MFKYFSPYLPILFNLVDQTLEKWIYTKEKFKNISLKVIARRLKLYALYKLNSDTYDVYMPI